MHFHADEVAPLAPLIIDLGTILVWAVGLALCLLAVYLVKALFGTANSAVGWIPWFGKVVTRPLSAIERKLVSFLSDAAQASDARMGAALHQTARLIDWMGEEIRRHANLLLTIATVLSGTAGAANLVRDVLHIRSIIAAARRELSNGIDRLAGRTHAVERGIGADVLPRIRAIDRELVHVIEPDLAALRHRARELEDGALHTFRWIKAHPQALASAAFASAVAMALARLGAGWIRCNNVRAVGRRLCGLPGRLLEDLLAGVIDVLVIADLCQLTKVMVATAESAPIQAALSGIIGGIDELLLCQGVTRPPALRGYWTAPPPAQDFAELPA